MSTGRFEATRLGHRHKAEPVIKAQDPRGRPIYWVGAGGRRTGRRAGYGFHAVRHGFVSITPIQVDLTRYDALDKVAGWLAGH